MPTAQAARTASELRLVVGQLIRRLRAEHAFPLTQVQVLSRLDRVGPATASAIAAEFHVRPQSMGETIAELHRAGLVDRTPDPTDGRRILVAIAERGRAELTEDRRRREGWLAEAIAAELSEDERRTLEQVLPLLARLARR
jgi:DNA-binding MarR family transcriptional regulator